jgi:hypothetical protein
MVWQKVVGTRWFTLTSPEAAMALVFVGIDPNTPGGNCPSVWIDDQTGDMVFQGWEETDEANRADIAARSPILDHERIVRLPARMVPIVREALEAAGDAAGRAAGGTVRAV